MSIMGTKTMTKAKTFWKPKPKCLESKIGTKPTWKYFKNQTPLKHLKSTPKIETIKPKLPNQNILATTTEIETKI